MGAAVVEHLERLMNVVADGPPSQRELRFVTSACCRWCVEPSTLRKHVVDHVVLATPPEVWVPPASLRCPTTLMRHNFLEHHPPATKLT